MVLWGKFSAVNEKWRLLALDASINRVYVVALAYQRSARQLNPIHLLDVILDTLNEAASPQHPKRPASCGTFVALGQKDAEIPFLLAAFIACAVRNQDLAAVCNTAQHDEVPAAGKVPGGHDRDHELAVL